MSHWGTWGAINDSKKNRGTIKRESDLDPQDTAVFDSGRKISALVCFDVGPNEERQATAPVCVRK